MLILFDKVNDWKIWAENSIKDNNNKKQSIPETLKYHIKLNNTDPKIQAYIYPFIEVAIKPKTYISITFPIIIETSKNILILTSKPNDGLINRRR